MSDEQTTRDNPKGSSSQPEATTHDSSASSPDVERLERELDEARSKAQSFLDLAQRTQADFVNYKRRMEQERSEFARGARADVILKVLPVLDDFERATESRPSNLSGSDWAQGIVLIGRKLRGALESLGVKPIEAVGQTFDPWQEEAVLHEPSTTYPSGVVTRILQAGYTLDGRVIRPAQVVVSSGPPEKPDQGPSANAGETTSQQDQSTGDQ